VRVGLLGTVHVEVDGTDRTPAGKRDRALLALLALRPGEVVAADEVAAGLWGSLVPPTGALDALVERVRHDCAGDALTSGAEGLTLVIEPTDVDALEAERLGALARDQVGDEQPWEALDSLDGALSLWRGPVLSGVEDVPFARPAIGRYDELRHTLTEERFELLFRLNRAEQAIEELRVATREHPTRERYWGQLMTALHREHRTQEALEVYAAARAVMADELGIEPGEALQRIEAAILLEDPARDPDLGAHPMPREAARLPVPRTPTYGRDELVASVVRSLQDREIHLVTLTGLGGSGKTRVATVAAIQLRDEAGQAVHYHEVTERETVDDVVTAVTAIVGEAHVDGLAEERALVVLDNVDACPDGSEAVSRLLEELPSVVLLATCRVPLRRRSEHTIAVPPLAVPEPGASIGEIEDSPAVQMFLRVAAQADAGFDGDGQEQVLAEVCRLLDGSPLAIELAAARVRLMGLTGLRESLGSGLELLRTTAADVPERQRAVATTIAWSHDRLGEAAQRLCRRLVIFGQAFTLEAVEAAAADVGEVIELLTQVMEAGLIRPLIGRIRIGFVMPVTVRSFVRRMVTDPRENDAARLALAEYLIDQVERWRADLDRAEGPLALARFLDVGADVHASIEATLRLGRIQEGVALTLASGPFWASAGELRPGLARTREVLKHVAGTSREAGRLHELAARLAYHLNDYEDALTEFERALAIAEPLGDEATVASSRIFSGGILVVTGELQRGTEMVTVGADAATRLDLYPLVAEALSGLAIAHAVAGEFDSERETHVERLAVARAHGDVARTADALEVLAEIALDEADASAARTYAEEALAIALPGLPVEAREARIALARAAVAEGDLAGAAATLGQAFEAAEKIGQKLAIAQCYRVAGCLAAARNEAATAVRLFAAAHRLRPSESGTDVPMEADLAAGLETAREALGADASAREWTVGESTPAARTRELLLEVVTAVPV
jgi:predicted ATPase/DNA-binding SARP family transcriptional activator